MRQPDFVIPLNSATNDYYKKIRSRKPFGEQRKDPPPKQGIELLVDYLHTTRFYTGIMTGVSLVSALYFYKTNHRARFGFAMSNGVFFGFVSGGAHWGLDQLGA